jgi:hypothetical protein
MLLHGLKISGKDKIMPVRERLFLLFDVCGMLHRAGSRYVIINIFSDLLSVYPDKT